MPRWWADGVPFVDELDRPRLIAITSGPDRSADKWFYSFYLGSRLQNRVRYIAPTTDGKLAHPGWKGGLEQRANKEAWLGRLDQAWRVRSADFAAAVARRTWMEETSDRFDKLAGNDDWGLFRIVR